MKAVERELRRQFEPENRVVRSGRGHYKIYGPCGCMLASAPGSPGEFHYMINTIQQVRRHQCPAKKPAGTSI